MNYRKIPFAQRDPMARARNPSLAGMVESNYAPTYPGGGFLGADAPAALPTSTTVMMRPQPNAPAGFPGFFGWLKTEHPDFYNYAVAALPSYVTFTEGHRTGGATLAGLMGLGDDVDSLDSDDVDLTDVSIGPIDPGTLTPVAVADPTPPATNANGSPAPSASVTGQIVAALSTAAPAILSTVNQQQVFQTQLARAAAGLPPLNTSAYGLTGAGVTGLSSGALLALLGVGALVLIMSGKKS